MAGLAPNEVPAILKRGEEVLTESDARHRNNGGGKGDARMFSQTLAIGDKEIAKAMAGRAGVDTVLTILKANKPTIRQMLK